jgi:transcriptional antiterminator RfaH
VAPKYLCGLQECASRDSYGEKAFIRSFIERVHLMDGSVGPVEDEASCPKPTMRWVAVNTHPHREHIAIENLERQQFGVYCPRELRTIRHARRTQDVARPLFPGYLFAAIEPDLTMWRPILSTFGVRAVIRFGERPAFVDDGFIEGLRAREVDGVIAKPATPYRVGQEIRLRGGPFDGLIAKIIEMKDKDRLVVLMNLLNQDVRLKVSSAKVRAL